jgi:type II secretory pathway pseudopilin PulG
MRIRRLVAAAAVPLLLASVGCEKDKEEAKKNAGQSCDGLLKSAQADAALPSTLPSGLDGAVFYEVQTQGATKRYFAYVQGTDLVATRDKVKGAYETAKIEIEGTDQEEGAEAEFEFKQGGTEGSVQVIPYCQGYLRVRYRVGPG